MTRSLAQADAQWMRGAGAAILGLALLAGGGGACALAPGLQVLAHAHLTVLSVLLGAC